MSFRSQLLSSAKLLAFVIALVLLVMSYFSGALRLWDGRDSCMILAWEDGRLIIDHCRFAVPAEAWVGHQDAQGTSVPGRLFRPTKRPAWWFVGGQLGVSGSAFTSDVIERAGLMDEFFISTWPIAVAAALPVLAMDARRRRGLRERAKGRCRACGYDLRATPDRCPECGRAGRE